MSVPGTLYIISAPSGAGKTSLVTALIKADKQIVVSVSHTTRKPRGDEEEGVHYHFVDEQAFNKIKSENLFLESAQVFGYWYGTSKVWVENQLKNGVDVILEIDWQGARRVREWMACQSIFILPPSRSALIKRLEERGEDDPAVINRRMQQASSEVSHFNEYDYVIVNDDFEFALSDLKAIIRARRKMMPTQRERWASLISELTT